MRDIIILIVCVSCFLIIVLAALYYYMFYVKIPKEEKLLENITFDEIYQYQ